MTHLLHVPQEALRVRSVERRRWTADLVGSAVAGLVLHGLGGAGKSMLAAEIAARASELEPERVTTVIRGEVSPDRFLTDLAESVRACPAASPRDGDRTAALNAAARLDLPWEDRLTRLREHVLGQVPVLVILDDFDDNLCADAGGATGATVSDPALAALLASWAGVPHLGRLLITCRSRFTLPGGAEQALGFRHLDPLSRTDVTDLATAMPALAALGEAELDQAWRLTGGHPRNLEYLDALLSADDVSFADAAGFLAGPGQPQPGQAGPGQPGSPEPAVPSAGMPAGVPAGLSGGLPGGLSAGLPAGLQAGLPAGLSAGEAETVAAAAGDRLLGALWDRLSPGAQHLLVGVSVYRRPVARSAALLPEESGCRVSELFSLTSQCAQAGLMTVDHRSKPPLVHVHRWTADELRRRLAAAGRGGELTTAHRRAADCWKARVHDCPQDRQALLESRYHLREAGVLAPRTPEPARPVTPPAQRQRRGLARLGLAVAVAACLIVAVLHLAASAAPASQKTPPSRALDARDPSIAEAAAWVAQQVSQGATIACSPAMCTALRGHGVAAARLRTLSVSSARLAAAGPPDANLMIETPAVRSQFGSSLVDMYAPDVMASFGSGPGQTEVRAVAPDGAAAYRAAQAAALTARIKAGRALVGNPQITLSPSARGDLLAGRVNTRLMITLATMAGTEPVGVISFTDAGPGASPGMPLRAALLTADPTGQADPSGQGGGLQSGQADPSGQASGLQVMLNFVRAQRPPYRPAYAALVNASTGQRVLIVEFAAPSPNGPL